MTIPVPIVPAAPLTPTDLLSPAGVLTPGLWPDLDSGGVTAKVQGYLDAGAAALTLLGQDPTTMAAYNYAQRAFVNWHAFLDVFTELALSPSSASITGALSASYGTSNQKVFKDMADLWESRYEQAVAAVVQLPPGEDAIQNASRMSGTAHNWFSW